MISQLHVEVIVMLVLLPPVVLVPMNISSIQPVKLVEATLNLVLPILNVLPVCLDTSKMEVPVKHVPLIVIPVPLQMNATLTDVKPVSLTWLLPKTVPLISLLLTVKLPNGSKTTYVPTVVKNV